MMRNWPLSALRLTTPRLELRWPTIEDLDALGDRGAEGVHDADFMPFFSQWTDGDPQSVARRVLQRHWTALGAWTPEDWTLYLAVTQNGTVIGVQSIGARNFAQTREVLVTAWLGRRFQGQGLGTEARAAMLELAFAGLGADYVLSVVRRENAPSQGVSRKLGFAHDGVQINAVRGKQAVSDRLRLDRVAWERHRSTEVQIAGLDDGLELFGLPTGSLTAARLGVAPPRVLAATLSGLQYDEEGDQPVD